MDVFGGGWDGYVEKLRAGFSRLTDADTCVLCGDLTWGMTMEEASEDFRFIAAIPGRKILLKGNHDYWFDTAAKARTFFAKNAFLNIEILNNNSFTYEDAAICGTRGWLFDENMDGTHNGKIMAREVQRLAASLKSAGEREKLCFFHYPPRFKNYVCEDIIRTMKEYGVKRCWYGHIHGSGHRFAAQGWIDGIEYNMISADFVNFIPQKICI
jgi:predicted phosphohydrolase